MKTEDTSNRIGYILEVDWKHADEIKEKTEHFPLCAENEISPQNKFSDSMSKMKSKTCTPCEKVIWE